MKAEIDQLLAKLPAEIEAVSDEKQLEVFRVKYLGKKGLLAALFKRLGEKAGIEKRVHPHGLRHTGAAEMRSEGMGIGIISKQPGHSSIATTARYLDHISPAAVVDAVRNRQWEA